MDHLGTTTNGGHHPHKAGRPYVTELVNQEISPLIPYAGIILVTSLVVFFLVGSIGFERFLIPRMYGPIYTRLNFNQRRGFVNHHVAALAKIIMLSVGAYPFFAVVASTATLHTLMPGSKTVTTGDVLTVLNQVFVAMYLFELLYRERLSVIAILHHVGTVVIASTAIAISVNWKHQPDATLEFMLCYVWGVFDVVAEFWPHVAIIQKRRYEGDHGYLSKVFLFAAIVTAMGTLIETIVVMYIWGWAWHHWSLEFKIITPILHIIFSAAQVWGAYKFWGMWQYEVKQMGEKKDEESQV